MDAAGFLEEWNGKFGAELQPPEWVSELSGDKQQENVQRKITESAERVELLRKELDKELFLLEWLRRQSEKKVNEEGSSFEGCSSSQENHVQGEESEQEVVYTVTFTESVSAQNSPRHSDKPSPGASDTDPSTGHSKTSVQSTSTTSVSEDSPGSSEYFTAASQSSGPEVEDSSTPQKTRESALFTNRHRFVHSVSSKDLLVAKAVSNRVLRRHSSCTDIAEVAKASEEKPGGRRKRIKSAPTERIHSPEPPDKAKKHRLHSSPNVLSGGSGAHGEGRHIETSPLVNSTQSQGRSPEKVVFREKAARRPSIPMSQEDGLSNWKGTGGGGAAVKRFSNSCDDYTFMVNDDEEGDPALINIMARSRGNIRTPRSSLSADQPLSDFEKPDRQVAANGGGWEEGRGREVASPKDDSNTPIPGMAEEPLKQTGIAPLRKRSSTQDSSPIKRFSYHYSDDECLTPKIDSGDHGSFSGNSPSGSNGCSNRNSRSSNGIIDEEDPLSYDKTLRRQEPDVLRKVRTHTITPGNVDEEMDHSRLAERPTEDPAAEGSGGEVDVLSTLTGHHPMEVGEDSIGSGASIFEKSSDSYTDELGSLDLDVELTLSKLRNKPEMSMATLLDMNENERLNTRANTHPNSSFKERTPEYLADSSEGIEIDEATISAFTLNSDLYGSRSNSATSLPGLFSDSNSTGGTSSTSPPEQDSPTHSALQGVSLRQGNRVKGGNRKQRFGNPDFELMATGMGSDTEEKSHSRSSTSLTSEEDSVPTSPPSDEDNLHSPGSRTSRMFPVRHSTVVVHGGEQLVIRKLVIVGVVSAEKIYIECLSVMKEYYRKPLLALTTVSQPIISEKDINTIFYRIDDLHQVHSTLHEQLERVLANWSVGSCVGEFFVQLCRNLKLYKDYVEMYQKAMECLNRNKMELPQFKKFLEDVHVTVTRNSKDVPKVNELLRRPIERLQSYSLVLNDLCQHTPVDHADHRILRESLQAMSAFITSTHDPQAFRELSGGYNREMVKEGLVVELSEGFRKIRRLFLFHDVLVSAKQKPTRTSMKFEAKWYLPLSEVRFKCPPNVSKNPVPVTSEMELSIMKNRVAELKAQVTQHTRERTSSTSSDGFNIRRNIFMIKYGSNKQGSSKQSEKIKKKLQEQQVSYWVASPSLPLRLFGRNDKQYMFLLHNEDERENWISAIKKLIPKAVSGVSLTSFELQDLLSRQTINDLRKVEEMIVPTTDDEYLSGVLRVRVMAATELKAKSAGLYCCLELDEYGKFERKARTLPTNTDGVTLETTWDQDFELELVGSHTLKVLICSKSLLKEETYAHGKVRLPIKELKQNKRQKLQINLNPQGVISLVIEYFANMASLARKPTLQSSGVFGVPIEVVAARERHDIPLIVQTCVDEVEKRGLEEVGVYRVAGVLRDVQELRHSFDTDYLKAQVIAFETDIHAVAGLLKRYFRELPDPLFTEELYLSFVQALGLSDPEARDQCFISLLHSLPPVNFKTAVFLFKHLRRVAANSDTNKMTHTNLATIFGINLLRPGGAGTDMNMAAMDVVTPVSVVLYYLNCPEEYFDEGSARTSPDSTFAAAASGGSSSSGSGGGGGGGAMGGVILRRGSNQFKDQKSPDDLSSSGGFSKGYRRSRRSSNNKMSQSSSSVRSSSSSIKTSAAAKNPSTNSVGSFTPSRESAI